MESDLGVTLVLPATDLRSKPSASGDKVLMEITDNFVTSELFNNSFVTEQVAQSGLVTLREA